MNLRFSLLATLFFMTSACINANKSAPNSKRTYIVDPLRCNTAAKSPADPKEFPYGPTCEELITQHPVLDRDQPAEEKRIICPFLRMLQRTGLFKENAQENLAKSKNPEAVMPITLSVLERIVQKFGLVVPAAAFGSPAGVAAAQQGRNQADMTDNDTVDIGRLTEAPSISHNCGFNFLLNAKSISDEARNASLASLKASAKDNRILFSDLEKTKAEACARDYALYLKDPSQPLINPIDKEKNTLGLTMTDHFELALLFMYLGGADNGYILYSDIELFFHGKMPANKTKYVLTPELAGLMKQAIVNYLTK